MAKGSDGMATNRQKNSGKQKKRQLWKKILCSILGIGLQVFLFLAYFTFLPVNKPISPEDTNTVTVVVQNTAFGQRRQSSGRTGGYKYFYLNIDGDTEDFQITGRRNHDWYGAQNAYSVPELHDVIQAGDTLTVTYRKFYPWLMPQKYVVGIREGNQIYRSLDNFNENAAGTLVWSTAVFIVAVLLTLPITLFFLDVPTIVLRKAKEKRRKKEKAVKLQKTAPD